MKTINRKEKLEGFISERVHMRLLKKKKPEAYSALKRPGPRTCIAWNTLDRRGKLGISQTELAEKSGVSRRSIQYLEDITTHFSPSLDLLEKVSKALKLEVTDLLKPVDLTQPLRLAKPTPKEHKEIMDRVKEMKTGKLKEAQVHPIKG
jgi:transcriptional regulator with XRE-family HTH domain